MSYTRPGCSNSIFTAPGFAKLLELTRNLFFFPNNATWFANFIWKYLTATIILCLHIKTSYMRCYVLVIKCGRYHTLNNSLVIHHILPFTAMSKVMTPVQESTAGRLSAPADGQPGLDGIEEEGSTVLTRIGYKVAQDKSLSRKRIKSKSQPKSVKEVVAICWMFAEWLALFYVHRSVHCWQLCMCSCLFLKGRKLFPGPISKKNYPRR